MGKNKICQGCGGEGYIWEGGMLIDVPDFCPDCNKDNVLKIELPIFYGD